ncbi:hypothetical protein M8007_11545 [Dinoroseobacter shibae]|uniref:hypothetical protein n=1 Tax=Dinoroseobacter shibae TaxID=215813 RepID=UPI00202179B8|nr:hypothetical protein [Dinoroseobacter shibae]URF49722.1 hypothetical protein M8007_11545 [Dinoroseobacter shibae]
MTFPPILSSLAAAVLTLTGTAVCAETWNLRSHDDGSFFLHSMSGPAGSFALECGEKSVRGLSPLQTGNTTPRVTRADALRIGFGSATLGLPRSEGSRSDVMLVVGRAGFQLPELIWDELDGSWGAELSATDPAFTEIAQAEVFGIYTASDAQMRTLSAVGFGSVHARLLQSCAAGFAAIGQPWVVGLPEPAAPWQANGTEARARTALTEGCNGAFDLEPSALLRGQIDGDGIEDVVLDWGSVTCRSGPARPFCGAAMCSVDVFLSARSGAPETLLALGVRLQPLSNGLQGVATGGSLAMCQDRGGGSCEFLWYWTGTGLEELR